MTRSSSAPGLRRFGKPGVRAWRTSLRADRSGVLIAAAAMIVAQLAYRTWALGGGWFLIDDYGFLSDAVGQPLTLDYLLQPHNDHLQPLGFAVAWIVGQSSPFNWPLATVITMAFQALADVAALVFLVRLAGKQWSILVPLAVYLFAVITLPGFLWWCVATLQVPLQLAAFLAMMFHLQYIRTRRLRFIPLTCLALVLGMTCDVKVAFIPVALAFLSLYLSDEVGVLGRVVDAVWRQGWAWVTYAVLFAAYLWLYLHVNPLRGREGREQMWVFEVMVRHTLGPTLVGGPWQWGEMRDTPLVPASPPEWAVTVSWVVLALWFAGAVRRRHATAWALVPVIVCLVVNVAMVSVARGALFGRVLGLEVRYLGDLAPVITLMVAVVSTGMAPRADTPSRSPTQPPGVRKRVLGLVTAAAILAGMLWSSTQYVENWHTDYPARKYTQNVIRQSSEHDLALVDAPVPLEVIPRDTIINAFDRPSQLFKPLSGRVFATLQGNDLQKLDAHGHAFPAGVLPGAASAVTGPVAGCGWRVTDRVTRVPLSAVKGTKPVGSYWWGSVGYLASADGVVQATVGSTEERMRVRRGLHTYVFLGSGEAASMRLRALTPTVVCVDTVRLGDLVPVRGESAGGGTP